MWVPLFGADSMVAKDQDNIFHYTTQKSVAIELESLSPLMETVMLLSEEE